MGYLLYPDIQALGIAKFCLGQRDMRDVYVCPRAIAQHASLTSKKMHTTQQVAKMHRNSE